MLFCQIYNCFENSFVPIFVPLTIPRMIGAIRMLRKFKYLCLSTSISDEGNTLAVITTSEHVKGTSGYVLSVITYENGYFVHENHHSYYEEIGAEKYLTLALGREWTGGDVMDDYR